MTQVTILLADNPTWGGVLRGMLVLAALWWAWSVYAWLTSTLDLDEGGTRLTILAATAAMLIAALAVPGAFGDDAVLFGAAYFVVRFLHLVLSILVARDDAARLGAILRFAPTAMLGASLLVAGRLPRRGHSDRCVAGGARDRLSRPCRGRCRARLGIAPEHFAERHGLIILIALGESLIAIGVGAGFELEPGVIVAALLGVVVVSALWWLYFDIAAIVARRRLMQARGLELHRLALHSYSYLHLPMVAGIVLFALGLKTTLGHLSDTLDTVPAVGLCGGAALYLLGEIALPLPDDRPHLPPAIRRRGRPARAGSRRSRGPGAGSARPRRCRLLTDRRVRGTPLPRGPSPPPTPRTGGVSGTSDQGQIVSADDRLAVGDDEEAAQSRGSAMRSPYASGRGPRAAVSSPRCR